MITKRRKRSSTLLFFKKWALYRLYRKRPPRFVNRTVPKIIVISVHTVNRFPLNKQIKKNTTQHRKLKRWAIQKSSLVKVLSLIERKENNLCITGNRLSKKCVVHEGQTIKHNDYSWSVPLPFVDNNLYSSIF
jgi:hypothetical protein